MGRASSLAAKLAHLTYICQQLAAPSVPLALCGGPFAKQGAGGTLPRGGIPAGFEGTGGSWARPWGLLLLLGARAGHVQLL